MACFEMFYEQCECFRKGSHHSNAILYNILSQKDTMNNNYSVGQYNCHCKVRRSVRLKNPEKTCQGASDILVKTISFMKNLPSFHQLPIKDQLALLQSSWAPLFILGLAQEGVNFDVTDVPATSMLKRILLDGQIPEASEPFDRPQPTLVGVQRLKSCLNKLWSLDLSPKEYAYLKGTILFNPDVPGLRTSQFIESLQQEAQRALHEVLAPLHPEDTGRFARILLIASTLKTITPMFITELFFRPIIGQTDLLDFLAEMLFAR
ncbi:nuclear receptor subfamily 0 group B member 2-like [Polypterus senegalus]|nr:nuclear receptor subfamily 0 group B member 2-like [Polypterus senegalus]